MLLSLSILALQLVILDDKPVQIARKKLEEFPKLWLGEKTARYPVAQECFICGSKRWNLLAIVFIETRTDWKDGQKGTK